MGKTGTDPAGNAGREKAPVSVEKLPTGNTEGDTSPEAGHPASPVEGPEESALRYKTAELEVFSTGTSILITWKDVSSASGIKLFEEIDTTNLYFLPIKEDMSFGMAGSPRAISTISSRVVRLECHSRSKVIKDLATISFPTLSKKINSASLESSVHLKHMRYLYEKTR
jgi:hypothetical protein